MNEITIPKTCGFCACWERIGEKGKGECRANPPFSDGWRETNEKEWCFNGYVRDNRKSAQIQPEPKEDNRIEMGQVGFNFGYIRNYPEDACRWLRHVKNDGDPVPKAFLPVLADPCSGVITSPLNIFSNIGEDECDLLFKWAHAIPGGDVERTREDDYSSILCYLEKDNDYSKNIAILNSFEENHPWRLLCRQTRG